MTTEGGGTQAIKCGRDSDLRFHHEPLDPQDVGPEVIAAQGVFSVRAGCSPTCGLFNSGAWRVVPDGLQGKPSEGAPPGSSWHNLPDRLLKSQCPVEPRITFAFAAGLGAVLVLVARGVGSVLLGHTI